METFIVPDILRGLLVVSHILFYRLRGLMNFFFPYGKLEQLMKREPVSVPMTELFGYIERTVHHKFIKRL